MTRRNRDADNLAHRLDRAATIIPDVLDHLAEQRELVQPLPGRGGGPGQSGTHSDPTGSAFGKLADLDLQREHILDALESLETNARRARRHREREPGPIRSKGPTAA